MINQPQTIIHSLAGHQVPKELFETALRKCPTVSGYAIRDKDENGNVSLQTDKFTKTGTIDEWVHLDTEAKDYDAVFYLANLVGTYTKDDVQPYVMTIYEEGNDTGKDILSVFVEGDFPKFTDPKKAHTDEYIFYKEIIEQTLQDMFMAAECDTGKFIASLHKPLFEKQMLAHVGHRAAFVFLPIEGDAVKFGTNELGLGAEWGTCSQHLDFKKAEKPITSAVAGAVKRFNPFQKPTVTLPDGVHRVPDKKEDPVDKVATATMLGKHLVKPPTGLDKSGRNRWLRVMNGGQLPQNHDHRDFQGVWVTPDIVPYAERKVTTLAQVDALAAEMRTGIKKNGATQFVDKNATKVTSYPSGYSPYLDDVEMTSLTSTLAKFIDREKVPSALEIQQIEKPYPTFSEKGGIPFTDSLRWTGEEGFSLTHQGLTMLWLETRKHLIGKMTADELAALDPKAKVKDLTGTHVEAKNILKPDGTVASTVAAKRAAIFGTKKSA